MSRKIDVTTEDVERAWGASFETTAHDCHAVSKALVNARLFENARVARGWANGVVGQHSWMVVGDPYDADAPIVDATLWSYDRTVNGVWIGTLRDGVHQPHGWGVIDPGWIPTPESKTIELTPSTPFSVEAMTFLLGLGPLDARGWMRLANGPMLGWPAREIITAMLDTPGLGAFVPIDIQGMLTDRNPGGLYLPSNEEDDVHR